MIQSAKLPKGWISTTLNELCIVARGGSPRPIKDYLTTAPNGVNWIKIGDATASSKYICSTQEKIKPDGVKKSRLVKEGDFLLSNSMSFGRPYIMKTSGCVHDGWLILSPRGEAFNQDFLYHFLRSPSAYRQFNLLAVGSTVRNLNIDLAKVVRVPLPPLNEQILISKRLDFLQSHSRRAREALEKIPDLIENFRQSVLAAAFRGDLTKEWREKNKDTIEPASELLKRIRLERRKKWEETQLQKFKASGKTPKDDSWKSKYKDPAPVNTDDLPELPEGWAWASVQELAADEPNALKAGPFGSSLKKMFYTKSGYKVYGQEQVIRGDPYFGDYFIGEEKYESLKSCAVKPRDILISLVGTIGKILILPEDTLPGIINPRLLKLSLRPGLLLPEVFKEYFEAPQVRKYFAEISHGGTMEILNLSIIKNLPVSVPPLAEQSELLRILSLCWRNVEVLTMSMSECWERSLTFLDQSILAKAVRGELVPQDPNDEPASVLLERIKSDRASALPMERQVKKRGRGAAESKVEGE